MSKHVHELWWNEGEKSAMDIPFVCECGYGIDVVAALDYINAAEQLSAERAQKASILIHPEYEEEINDLQAYAKARGKE